METWTADEELHQRIQNAPKNLIAARIRRARKTADFTHDELGERMGGVTRQHLIKLEKGLHRPKVPMLRRLAMALDRDVDWFIDPEIDPSPFPVEADERAA